MYRCLVTPITFLANVIVTFLISLLHCREIEFKKFIHFNVTGYIFLFYSDLKFHHIHGKNARIVNNGLTAIRPRPLAEFNDAIVFSSRPLRDGELFEITLDTIVDRWSGSIELGK